MMAFMGNFLKKLKGFVSLLDISVWSDPGHKAWLLCGEATHHSQLLLSLWAVLRGDDSIPYNCLCYVVICWCECFLLFVVSWHFLGMIVGLLRPMLRLRSLMFKKKRKLATSITFLKLTNRIHNERLSMFVLLVEK